MDLKKKRTELQKLVNDAKALYAEIESKGDAADQQDRDKLNQLIADGEAKRAELEKLESLESMDVLVNAPAHEQRAREGARRARKSWGEQVVESEQFKKNDGRKMDRVMVSSAKALYNEVDTAGGALVVEDRQSEIIDIARQRPRTVIDLVGKAQTNSDAVEYVEMDSRTNAAAPVVEYSGGNFGLKPESNLTFELKTVPVKTVATWIAASRQILMDAPRLRALVDDELTYMLVEELEDQVLNGNGTSPNYTGILNAAGIQTRVMHASAPTGRGQTTSDTKIDTIRRAITDIWLEFYQPDGIVFYPGDSEAVELSKDADNRYLQVYDAANQRLWRVHVVESKVIASGTALVGNFKMGAKLWDRMQTEIRVGEPDDYFLRNAVAVLGELRAAFAVVRPLAFEKVTLI